MTKGNDYKKQTSTIAAARAMEILLAHNFMVAMLREVVDIQDTKQAYRKDILAARRRFGERAAISNTGRSITLVGPHYPSGRIVQVHVPLFEMLRHGELEQLQKITGLDF